MGIRAMLNLNNR